MQVIIDLDSLSFSLTNTRNFEQMMKLPELIYSRLQPDDSFGLNWLRGRYGALLFDDSLVCEDILQFEKVKMNDHIKRNSFKEITDDFVYRVRKKTKVLAHEEHQSELRRIQEFSLQVVKDKID